MSVDRAVALQEILKGQPGVARHLWQPRLDRHGVAARSTHGFRAFVFRLSQSLFLGPPSPCGLRREANLKKELSGKKELGMHSEVALQECATRAGFQIPFKCQGTSLVVKCGGRTDSPRYKPRCVRRFSRIVLGEPSTEITGLPCVDLARRAFGFEDVDVMEIFHPVESMKPGLALNCGVRMDQKSGKCGRIAAVD